MPDTKATRTVGAPRKYKTPAELRKAVNRYFLSISREIVAKEKIVIGYTEKGKPIYEEREIVNGLGEPMMIREYVQKPTVAGLCLFLKIHRDTWHEYKKQQGYDEIYRGAMLAMEADRAQRLGGGKGDQGIMFDLQFNFGWKKSVEVEVGEETRKAISPKTMAEKLEFLKSAGLVIEDDEEL